MDILSFSCLFRIKKTLMFIFNRFDLVDISFHLILCLSVALLDATIHHCCLFKFHEYITGCNIPVFWPPATVTAAQILWLSGYVVFCPWLSGSLAMWSFPLAHWLCGLYLCCSFALRCHCTFINTCFSTLFNDLSCL